MSTIKLTVLAPVHIGSGNLLQFNTDFFATKQGENNYLRIVDERKIIALIGIERVEDWVLSIESKENTKDFIRRYAPNSKVSDYSKRRIEDYSTGILQNDTLKECIHNGEGFAYIPGSSIKGAIRTAILATFVKNKSGLENKIQIGKSGNNVSAKEVEKELFGRDPNSDVFRFIRVGDAYFKPDCEIAIRGVNINIRNSKTDLYDGSKPQLLEAIGVTQKSEFQLKIDSKYYNWAVKNGFQGCKLTSEISAESSLFMLLNEHTRSLVESDLVYWKNIDKTGAEEYIQHLEDLLKEIEQCKAGSECVIRIGHASGWRFITGAWTERLSNFKSVVVPAARFRNNSYLEYDFPKSRRTDENTEMLGFVKLQLL